MTTPPEYPITDDPYRLSRHVVPSHYRIRLEPNLEASTFIGSEIVTVDIHEPTTTINVNAAELDIYEAHLRNASEHHIEATVAYDKELERATFTLDEEAGPGTWELVLGFSGILNDQLRGFYRSTFNDVDGNEQVIATTQFEASDARRAFPCWDEPDFKATYGVTLIVPNDLLAISNGPEIERIPVADHPGGDGKVSITFADTMKMSTYLVAFVVGPFEATEPVNVGGIPLRIVAPRGKQHLTDYAMECASFCLAYLSDYYGIAYPGDKLDMVAIPDFGFGAMENLGCVTYRETILLLDPETSTSAELLRTLDVVGHELAHMWFGDLVTMKWWNGIWLNEAFATFMELKATDARRPEWKRWLAFVAGERPWAFKVDDLASTRPVEFEVRSPDEAQAMFDALTYGKGSALLRMIEQFIGEEPFRKGVEAYLHRHSYANTETDDLWAALDNASGQPVGEIMDTWIRQGGYPQIDIRATESGFTIEQRRFLISPDESDSTHWKLPLQVRGLAAGAPFRTKILLDGPLLEFPTDGPIDWVVANAGGHGFYRTKYDERLFTALLEDVAVLDPIERYTIVDDSWAFVEAGQSSATAFLRLALRFEHEKEHAIWTALLNGVGAVGHHLVSDKHRSAFEHWVTELLSSSASSLGWEIGPDESDLTRRLRGLLHGAMGRLANHPDTIETSREVHDRLLNDRTSVDPEIAHAAVFTVAAHGDPSTYDAFLSLHHDAPTPQEALRYLQALASFDTIESMQRTFGLIVDDTVRNQDTSWVIARLLGNRMTGPAAWAHLRDNWAPLIEDMPSMTRSRLLDGLPALSEPAVADEIETFFSQNPLPSSAKAQSQKLERMRALVEMRDRESASVAAALADGTLGA